MFVGFFYALRRRKVPVSTQEWLALVDALGKGLHGSSLDGFYHLARAVLVKSIGHYDAFDDAFLATFRGVKRDALAIAEDLSDWLRDARRPPGLTEEERRMLEALSPGELRRLFEERLREQKERHEGGNRWIGTGGTSPFGQGGTHPTGLRLGEGGQRTAMQVAEERRFRAYRNDVVLDVRQIDLALRLLRDLGRDGAPEELDLGETIRQTARNAGELEVVQRAPRRNRVKLVLLMDVGGSMDPHAHLVERLFTAASRSGRFARFRAYYFHNCVHGTVFEDALFSRPVSLADLFAGSDRDEKLVLVGDAAMHPFELLEAGGGMGFHSRSRTPGVEQMRRLTGHFWRVVWLNPLPPAEWTQDTVEILRGMFPMFPLTLDGLRAAVQQLVRGGARVRAAPLR